MDAPVKTTRRARTTRHPTGKQVTPGAYEAIWFQKLWQHGPLTTDYLHTFTNDLVPSARTVKHRLGDLFHENNTPHGDAYLTRPVDQNRSTKRLHEIHENDAAAEEFLKERGLIPHTSYPCKRTNFRHRFMVSSITASVELTCRKLGISYIDARELLRRAPTGDLKVPLTITHDGHQSDTPLIPDGYFALSYPDAGFRVFLLEADRENEPIVRTNLDQTSYLRKILQYQKLLTRPDRYTRAPYHDHFGITAGMLVLNVTTSFAHMEHIIALVMKLTEGRGSKSLLFKVCPRFKDQFAVPPVLSEVLTTPWRRAGYPDIDISKP